MGVQESPGGLQQPPSDTVGVAATLGLSCAAVEHNLEELDMEKTSVSLGSARDWHTDLQQHHYGLLGGGAPYLQACVQNLVILLS